MQQNTSAILNYFKGRWMLWLVVVIFVVCKIPHLYYSFYWDESWSYEPAIRLMYEHGPSLMPNAIDINYSRGHPLLFYFCTAAWMKIFGPSAFSQHAFALLLFVLLIISVYEVCRHLFNKRTALLTLAIFPLQVIFFVQSTMLLPEIMVALLSLLSIYFYSTRRHVLTFVSLIALLFTKESGMVTGLLLGVDATIKLFTTTKLLKERLANFLPVLFAGLGITGFFVAQKLLNGWFFFPEHMGYISFGWAHDWDKIKYMVQILFNNDCRSYLFCILLLGSVIIAVKTRKAKYLLPLLIAVQVYICISGGYGHLISRRVLALTLMLSVVGMSNVLRSFTGTNDKASSTFIQLGIYFIALYICFCAVNFYTARYTIPALLMVLILASYYLDRIIALIYAPIYIAFLPVIALIGVYGLKDSKGSGDTDMGAFDGMKLQQDVVQYLQRKQYYTNYITTTGYQDYAHLTDPNTGFIQQKEFMHVGKQITDTTQLVIFNNIEPSGIYDGIKNKYKNSLVYRAEHNGLWAEIYRLK
ncbi:MAG: glycosyltransferase family 39 protein [Flavipsychrobacter sp.]|nr:glycosyltransferase family 39 protein [Flavipsychrobacter sp.]